MRDIVYCLVHKFLWDWREPDPDSGLFFLPNSVSVPLLIPLVSTVSFWRPPAAALRHAFFQGFTRHI